MIRVCEEIEAAAFLGDFFEFGFHFVRGKGEDDACFPVLASILCTFPKPSMKYRFPS